MTVEMTGDYPAEPEEDCLRISYARINHSQPAQKAFKLGLDIANDGGGPVPIWYDALNGNASGFKETTTNMENLKKHLHLDRVLRINDRGCFSAKIAARTREQGFHLISSISWTSRHERLFLECASKGIAWERLSYLSQMEKRKKDPSRQRGYQAFEIDFPSQYQRVSYPFRLIFVKSDGKIQRDKKSRDKHLRWIEKELAQLRGHLGHPRNQNRPQLMKRLQRILARYPEGKYYQVKISPAEGSVKEMEVIIGRKAFRQTEQLDGLNVIFILD